ncbi:hypothetical protein NM688_g1915 [Phlebia brevispora]|uniref:Uncharacterized protein n=1 Tax=Phlebia brevispora TaxID=194682 RepID=A0ACC1TA59_9APHY|nr:hypothetical protein NM688_g1915 [Phlebia brevispora]
MDMPYKAGVVVGCIVANNLMASFCLGPWMPAIVLHISAAKSVPDHHLLSPHRAILHHSSQARASIPKNTEFRLLVLLSSSILSYSYRIQVVMVFASLLLSLLLAVTASCVPVRPHVPFPPIPITPKGLLCGLPIPIVQKLLCPRQGSTDPVVNTPLGTAHGVTGAENANRFAVKYATAARWQPSSIATSWELPNNNTDPSALPLACPQFDANGDFDPTTVSEDCLSMLLYVPNSISPGSNVPTILWIHGGSFETGSSTFPGLDGSNLSTATNAIVAVVQYRLGVLGLMPPSGETNFAIKDVINALQFLHQILPSFGGDPSKITIAGQSSGANVVRALLAIPSISNLFQSGILQSDPMDYGFLSMEVQQEMQAYFNSLLPCSTDDTDCLNNMSVSDLLNLQQNVIDNALTIDLSTGQGEPIRMVKDGVLITTTLDDTTPFPHVTKPLLITNVQNEAGLSIYMGAPDALDAETYDELVQITFFNDSPAVLNSTFYSIPAVDQDDEDFDTRPTLENLGTDQIWRCPGWTFARNWISNGGNAYVGHYVVGASYPGNDAVSYCTEPGIVCHQDDIEIVFGTVPSPNAQQAALVSEMQARYKAFLLTGNPNVAGHATWNLATSSDVHSLVLGGSGEFPDGGCEPSFFGEAVLYDYQRYNI